MYQLSCLFVGACLQFIYTRNVKLKCLIFLIFHNLPKTNIKTDFMILYWYYTEYIYVHPLSYT